MANKSIVGAGDDAQLLAGATTAVLARTGLYPSATALLNDALDDSYINDPVWQGLSFDSMVDFNCVATVKQQRHAASKSKSSGQRKTRSARKKKPTA